MDDPIQNTVDQVAREQADVQLSADARARIARRIAAGAPAGGTTVRHDPAATRRPLVWAGGVVIALVLVAVIVTVDRQTTVSAQEVLGRSQQTLNAPLSGIEVMTYDLALDGVLDHLLPLGQAGRFTIEEMVDHDHPGRYRLSKLATDGSAVLAIADDPVTSLRTRYLRIGDEGILLRVSDTRMAPFTVASARRTALELLIGVMRASDQSSLHETMRDGVAVYEINVPRTTAGPSSLLALDRARVVVARDDARLLDADASGTIGGQPFSVAFALRSRELRPASSARAADFALAGGRGDRVIDIDGSSPQAAWEFIARCLRP